MGNLLSRREQYELIVENIILKVYSNIAVEWNINESMSNEIKYTLSGMRRKYSTSFFDILPIMPDMLFPYIDDKYKKIFHYEHYKKIYPINLSAE